MYALWCIQPYSDKKFFASVQQALFTLPLNNIYRGYKVCIQVAQPNDFILHHKEKNYLIFTNLM